MPNGRPRDHPLTDMLHHNMPSGYPDDIFILVQELSLHERFPKIKDRLSSLLWENWPLWKDVEPDLERVRNQLRTLQLELDEAA